MKLFKNNKIICLIVALVTLFSLMGSAFAAGPVSEAKNSTLTIQYSDKDTGEGIPGARFDVYYVADRTNYSEFKVVAPFDDCEKFPIKVNDQTIDGWNKEALALKGYIQYEKVQPNLTGKTDQYGILKFSDLKPGLYLVVGQQVKVGNTTYTTAPYFVALPDLNMETNQWVNQLMSNPKPQKHTPPSDNPPDEPPYKKVLKVWDDDGSTENRPKEIVIYLLRDEESKPYDKAVLSEANNWRFQWTELDNDHEWTVVEKENGSYYVVIEEEGDTIIVTNKPTTDIPPDEPPKEDIPPEDTPGKPPETPPKTDNPPKLPQTGLMWWPVAPLVCGGLLCIIIGVVKKEKDARDG